MSLYNDLCRNLEGFGLYPRYDLSTSIQKVCKVLLDSIKGEKDKWAIPMPTGTGKTVTIATFIAHVQKEGLDYPTLIAVPNVQSMAELVKLLETLKADTSRIGCVLSEEAGDKEDREYLAPFKTSTFFEKETLIICHARVKNSRLDWEAMLYRSARQRAVFYDEALIYGSVHDFSVALLDFERKALISHMSPQLRDWIEKCADTIEKEPTGSIIHLPAPPDKADELLAETIKEEHRKLRRGSKPVTWSVLPALLLCARFRKESDGIISYDYTLPDNIETLFVFDASHMHSFISMSDISINVLDIPHDLKHYNNVTIFYNREGRIGKDWSERNYRKHKEFLANTPDDRLVICFKDMAHHFKEETKLLTWGKHAGVNRWRDTENVVLLGVQRLSNSSTAGDMTLTVDDIRVDVSRAQVCADEEQMLTLYQAISRGTMRKARWEGDKLQAAPCTIYVAGRLEIPMQSFLREVMPGVKIRDMKLESFLSKALKWLETKASRVALKDLYAACGASSLDRGAKVALVALIKEQGEWFQPGKSRSLLPVAT